MNAAEQATLDELRDEIERLRTLHADSPNRNYGDGDADSLWNRIEKFRDDPDARLSDEDVRELAEWWNELHQMMMEMDDRPDLFPVFDTIDRLLKDGHYFHHQDGKLWLWNAEGEGVAYGETFRELCVNIVLMGL
jgi:hypothetical protein